MMNSIDTNLQFDDKTKEELLENILVTNTEPSDFGEMVRILAKTFEFDGYGMPPHRILNMMEEELVTSKVDLYNSVKLIDKTDGRIYGLLVYSHFPMAKGSPLFTNRYSAMIGEYLLQFKEINGFAFIIDKRLRGTGLDKQMIKFSEPYLMNYDFVWCATESGAKSTAYWKRYGFIEVWDDDDSVFYIRNVGKKNMNDVFILKLIADAKNKEKNGKNSSQS